MDRFAGLGRVPLSKTELGLPELINWSYLVSFCSGQGTTLKGTFNGFVECRSYTISLYSVLTIGTKVHRLCMVDMTTAGIIELIPLSLVDCTRARMSGNESRLVSRMLG